MLPVVEMPPFAPLAILSPRSCAPGRHAIEARDLVHVVAGRDAGDVSSMSEDVERQIERRLSGGFGEVGRERHAGLDPAAPSRTSPVR